MKVLVTGATGFVGRAVVSRLLDRGAEVWAGSRRGESLGRAQGVRLDVTDPGQTAQVLRQLKPDAVVHLVGIIEERGSQTFERVHTAGTRNVLEATPPGTRYVHMSALGASESSSSGYSRSKAYAEALVRDSGLPFTIFRPSLIFGPGDDFFGRVLRELVSAAPVVPQIGDGRFPFRPVSVQDVTQAFSCAALDNLGTGQTYALTGPEEYTFRQLLELELRALGKRKPIAPVPLLLMDLAVPLMQLLPRPPITRDQYAMLKAGNSAPGDAARDTFALPMHRLPDALAQIVGAAQRAAT